MSQKPRMRANLTQELPPHESASLPIVHFHRLIEQTRPPMRADRSAAGTLPTRATRYCEAATSAAGFGWWVFPPTELNLLWDGDSIFWQYKNEWLALTAAQFPGFCDTFDAVAPADLAGCAPPFLTVLPEPGTLQIWTGLIARTAPDWSLLIRPPANLPLQGGYALYEGIVETDRWFGPLFTNLRFTRSNSPIRLAADFPLAQVQPIPRHVYGNETLASANFTASIATIEPAEWDAYRASIVEPNSRPDRPFGDYATKARKRRNSVCPASRPAALRPAAGSSSLA